jgi:hypothetical protein
MTIAVTAESRHVSRRAPVAPLATLEVEFLNALQKERDACAAHTAAERSEKGMLKERPADPILQITEDDVRDGLADKQRLSGERFETAHFFDRDMPTLRAFKFRNCQSSYDEETGSLSITYTPMPDDQRVRVGKRIAEVLTTLDAFYTPERAAEYKRWKQAEKRTDDAHCRAWRATDRIVDKINKRPASSQREVALKVRALHYHLFGNVKFAGADQCVRRMLDSSYNHERVAGSLLADLLRLTGMDEVA